MADELILLCRNSVFEDLSKDPYIRNQVADMITVCIRQKPYPDHSAVYHEKARLI